MGRLLTVVLCAAAVAVTACGGTKPASEQKTEVSPNVLAKALARTIGAGTSRVALEMTSEITFVSDGEKKTQSLSSEATGVFDFQRQRGTVTASFSGEAAGFLENDSSRYVFASAVTYWRPPPGTEQVSLPPGKSWLRFDTKGLSAAEPSVGSPLEVLRLLRAAMDDVFRSGAEPVRGVDTTHYVTTIDVTPNGIPIDVWIDEKGLIRKQRYGRQYESPSGAHIDMTMTMDLYDFGSSVRLKVPHAGEVVDAREVIGRKGG